MHLTIRISLTIVLLLLLALLPVATVRGGDPAGVDFNRDIRPILSNKCFQCHGPDEAERQGGMEGLRFDTEQGAFEDLGGYPAIVRRRPEESVLIQRIKSEDDSERMPPADSGKQLTQQQIQLLEQWVREGAHYAPHWSYVKPQRPALPELPDTSWSRNEIDYFILHAQHRLGLRPSEVADPATLIRRLSLDLTGLPPTVEEVQAFVNDSRPEAYELLVDRLLNSTAYGEHWARMWLDLARYADSSGYADDPPRTIWAYRDYVIRSFNDNKPFDQFTIEQIAGDLLPDPSEPQLVATAFHRNTLTNNEGGTNDEEFRNVAVVDRVNTTMAVWMGTTIACAQCHSHKYDPITQDEFFQLFDFFNSSADADRRDESPLLEIYTDEQRRQEADWKSELASLESQLTQVTPDLASAAGRWQQQFAQPVSYEVLPPGEAVSAAGKSIAIQADHSLLVESGAETDTYTIQFPIQGNSPTAIRLEALTDPSLPQQGPGHAGGNFVVTRVQATVKPPGTDNSVPARYVRIEMPGQKKILSLAEVQVFRGGDNIAAGGTATQSSVSHDGRPELAIDGNTNGHYFDAKSTTHTEISDDPWWQLDLGSTQPLDRIAIWNRTDNNLESRLVDFRIVLLDENRQTVWEQQVADAPRPSTDWPLSGVRGLPLSVALADFVQQGFDVAQVTQPPEQNKDTKKDGSPQRGWAIAPETGKPHTLDLFGSSGPPLADGTILTLTIEHKSSHAGHSLGRFRVAVSRDERAERWARIPAQIRSILQMEAADRQPDQQQQVAQYYLSIAPELDAARDRIAKLRKQLADLKPYTTVPVMRELPANERRVTRLQRRGNYLEVAHEVTAGVPAALHPLPEDAAPDRLALARWLIDADNPLTARVIVNRYWEKLFGLGIVRTSEEFGSQGELPSHPELLDWLAVDLMEHGWDLKRLLKQIVMSATYRQSSRVTPAMLEQDPDNRWLARGPRFRLTAEMIRDQALAVSGLLSDKLYGPPAKPPQPSIGLNAAFGSGIDWSTSEGEDRYRRGLYTTWRRSNPYPSMATFDAPNREVCIVRRDRTNTPLQALVTLNDPVFVEAAQALGRRLDAHSGSLQDQLTFGFQLCVAREPEPRELDRLAELFKEVYALYQQDTNAAQQLATQPLGAPPEGSDLARLAAWTVVGNVLLNLDEFLMKR